MRWLGMPPRRRAGGTGAAAFTPLSIPGSLVWLRGDMGISLDGSSNVQTWSDQSGTGNHFGQSTAGQRPPMGTINGKPAVSYTSASVHELNCLALSGFPAAASEQKKILIYMVWTPSTGTSKALLNTSTLSNISTKGFVHFTAGFTETLQNFGVTAAESTTYAPLGSGVARQTNSYFNTADGKRYFREQKVAKTSSAVLVSAPPVPTVIKLGGAWTFPSISYSGLIGEFGIWYPSPSLADIQLLENYSAAYWGL